jgi:integrase
MPVIATDESFLLSERQCLSILDWAAQQPQNGLAFRAFLASIALAALRPREALALRVRDLELDDEGSGLLLIRPEGEGGSAKGSAAAGTARSVPADPELVAILTAEITRSALCPDDAMFVLDDGQPLTPSACRTLWRQARAAVLEVHEVDSPLGRNVSALRDACIAAWLRNGDQTAAHILSVAQYAGLSAVHLVERFGHCLRRPSPEDIPWDRLEAAFRLPGPQSEPSAAARRP